MPGVANLQGEHPFSFFTVAGVCVFVCSENVFAIADRAVKHVTGIITRILAG